MTDLEIVELSDPRRGEFIATAKIFLGDLEIAEKDCNRARARVLLHEILAVLNR